MSLNLSSGNIEPSYHLRTFSVGTRLLSEQWMKNVQELFVNVPAVTSSHDSDISVDALAIYSETTEISQFSGKNIMNFKTFNVISSSDLLTLLGRIEEHWKCYYF